MTVELTCNVRDIGISMSTGQLVYSCEDHTIYKMDGIMPTKCCTVEHSYPYCRCVTPANTIVVAFVQNVTEYTDKGVVLCTLDGTGNAKVLLPVHITVSPITGDIAVCEGTSDPKTKQKPCVVLFDKELNMKGQYFGIPKSHNNHLSGFDFTPVDCVYDSMGCLLIADKDNMCIQLVSRDGTFLSSIRVDQLQPSALTLVDAGLLCIGFVGGTLKVIKY